MNKCHFYILLLPAILVLFACESDPAGSAEDRKNSPEASLATLEVADGLEVRLFASEPLLSNPTNIDVDARGRVWVTEAWNYRNWLNTENPYREQGDRIVILEDMDGDGQADTAKVFFQDTLINAAMGIAVLGNQVVVSCSPGVYLLTDTDGDDKADTTTLLFSGIGGLQHDHAVHAFVFGPDGKLYFNFGNEGHTLLGPDGQALLDPLGRTIRAGDAPYRQGMAFRCNPNGSELEVIGHNFRNPYELAVDSYGRVWQSDNDDDGNRSTRINFVMEYGNYGYTDELTGARWTEWRINREDSVPRRHWHQDDPGVVPNLLVNGAGSPSGLCIYEGSLLPAGYQGQLIHAEAGQGAIRIYPVHAAGAGFEATRKDLLFSREDNWFRPVDVCPAPDGSLMVADWYDPGVGGHRAGDVARGRIYRIAPRGHAYRPERVSVETPEAAIAALASPAQSLRYLGWTALHVLGNQAETALKELFTSGAYPASSPSDPRLRARALWLLAKLPENGPQYLELALGDDDGLIRATAIRAARQMDMELAQVLQRVADDPSPEVRRAALIGLHYLNVPERPALWARLAAHYDGSDPWYLEALGIAAANDPDACFEAWLESGGDPATPEGRQIVWRSRSAKALPLLVDMASAERLGDRERRKLFRAIEFSPASQKNQALLSLLRGQGTSPEAAAYALMLVDPDRLSRTPAMKQTMEESLRVLQGKPEYIQLVARFHLQEKSPELLKIALDTTYEQEMRERALTTIVQMDRMDVVRSAMEADERHALILIRLLPKADDDRVFGELERIILDEAYRAPLRRQAVSSLGATWTGSDRLMRLAESDELPPLFDTLAKEVLSSAWRPDVLARARAFYREEKGDEALPPVSTLLGLRGDASAGAAVYTAWCSSCHVVNGKGIAFGPELSGIGAKLSEEGLYDAILHPDKGINFGYEGYTVTLRDGRTLTGYLTGETESGISLRVIGGQTHQIARSEVRSRKPYGHSLMPSGLGEAMGKNQLLNLIAYLRGLKNGG
ncbi:MAG: PQQ-dependent sugar dehydrogenase [Solitalea sp.]